MEFSSKKILKYRLKYCDWSERRAKIQAKYYKNHKKELKAKRTVKYTNKKKSLK